MKHSSLGTLMALIASVLISASEGFAQHGLSIQTAQPVRLTVAPKVSTPIAMKTLPEATCVLHANGASDAQHSLKLFADDEGVVRFHIRPSGESDQSARFDVDCAADGKISIFPLRLRPSSSPTAEMPAPPAEVAKSRPGALIRPALTEDDAMHLPAEELAQRGYPMRPDPDKAPEAFATWLKAVTSPSRFVSPRLVPHPEVTHSLRQITNGFENTNNWSGFELRGGGNSYDWVMGEWYVPSVYNPEPNQTDYSAFWIGLDGDGTSDLVQEGTEQDITNISIPFLGINFDFATYRAWTEFLPQQTVEQVIGGFTVNPGDLIFSEVWIGNPGGPVSLSGAYGIFFIEDLSSSPHQYTTIYTPKGSTYVGGSEAEWIMERPGVGCGTCYGDLADYGITYMFDAYAHIVNAGPYFMNYDGASYQQIFMWNGNDLLSGAYPLTRSEMVFYWFGYH